MAPDAQPMTDANAQPRMATNAEAMTTASQLLPATDFQPMAAINAFCQNVRCARVRDWAGLILEWYRDHAQGTDNDTARDDLLYG